MKWDYEGQFLKMFERGRRSLIANQFCYAVREGCSDVDEVLERVRADADYRIVEHGDHQSQDLLLELIDTEEARNFAQHILARERLSWSEKEKLKKESGKDFARAFMAEQPPTLKQLAYLKSLGCDKNPNSKLEAHDLIDKYKSGNVQRSEQSAQRT